jgi:hypothetical protein
MSPLNQGWLGGRTTGARDIRELDKRVARRIRVIGNQQRPEKSPKRAKECGRKGRRRKSGGD